MEDTCGHWMPSANAPCARKPGHKAYHHPGYPCTGCGQLISHYGNSTGLCRACRKNGACARCGKGLYAINASGLCKSCKSLVRGYIRRVGLNQIKLAAGCADCGFKGHPDALVFSHVRGEDRHAVGLLYNRAWQRVLDEIAKCDVTCANCHAIRNTRRLREKFRDHQHARGSAGYLARRAVVSQVKLAAGCTDCGYRERAEALQFDHENGEGKVAGIGRMTGAARGDLATEMAKCAVRCANCHAIRTAELAGWERAGSGSWEGIGDDTRNWALGKAREVGVTDERAIAAVVVATLQRLPLPAAWALVGIGI